MQAKRGAGSRHTSRNIGGRVTHPAKEKKPPQATEGGQCAIGMQAATPMSDRVVTSHTHTHIATSPPAHRAITLQGMEAMERGRVQPPSLVTLAALIHPDIITPAHRAITLQGNEAGCRRPHR